MTARELLFDLRCRDIHLQTDGQDLEVDAPKGVLTQELVETIASWKPELLSLLRPNESSVCNGSSTEIPRSEDHLGSAARSEPYQYQCRPGASYKCFVCGSEVFWKKIDSDHWVCP